MSFTRAAIARSKFVSPPTFQRCIELVVRPVRSSAIVAERLVPAVGNKYLLGGIDLRRQRSRKQFLLVLCSQVRNCYPCNRKSCKHDPSFDDSRHCSSNAHAMGTYVGDA